jgi:DNA-binding response OmpR family regulator
MTMPNMTGAQLASEILKIKPEIPIIICTGYSETLDEIKAAEIGIRDFIMKPIIIGELAARIRKVLDHA